MSEEIVGADEITAVSCANIHKGQARVGVMVMMITDGQTSAAIHVEPGQARKLARVLEKAADEATAGKPAHTISTTDGGVN